MKKKQRKSTPSFSSEAEEREFWENKAKDSTEYLDWSKAKPARLTNLKPSNMAISIRLPLDLLESIKVEANRLDVPYQSFMKILLADGLKKKKKAS
jgi:predicted DNA binding CopG/RHH family protein